MTRTEHWGAVLGRRAFWGQSEALSEAIRWLRGYWLDGRWHLANGLSLDEYIEAATRLVASRHRVGRRLTAQTAS